MVKPIKFIRRLADQAERTAQHVSDPEEADDLRALATAYRSQADILKQKKKAEKEKR
jgi:hypothetical protein